MDSIEGSCMIFHGFALFLKGDQLGVRRSGAVIEVDPAANPYDLRRLKLTMQDDALIDVLKDRLEFGTTYLLRLCWMRIGPNNDHARSAAGMFELTRTEHGSPQGEDVVPERLLELLYERVNFPRPRDFKLLFCQSGDVRHLHLKMISPSST